MPIPGSKLLADALRREGSPNDLDYSQLSVRPDDYVVVATQHKGDHGSLPRLLRGGVCHVALIASRKRSRLMLDFLRQEGFGEGYLARVRAPAGLDLGARTPDEIALSVVSEIVMLRRGAMGARTALESSDRSVVAVPPPPPDPPSENQPAPLSHLRSAPAQSSARQPCRASVSHVHNRPRLTP